MLDTALETLTLGGAADTGADGLILTEQPLRGMLTVRCDLSDPAAAKALFAVAGIEGLPPRRMETGSAAHVLWMSPDEVLLICPRETTAAVTDALADALSGIHHLIADVSDARAIFRLEGHAAREVLAKGAPVDLSRAAFGVGDLRRTRIGQVAAAFYQIGDGPDAFEIICFRSYARYLWDWLVASSREGSMPRVLTS